MMHYYYSPTLSDVLAWIFYYAYVSSSCIGYECLQQALVVHPHDVLLLTALRI